MFRIILGLALLAAAGGMLWLGKPQANGSPAPFLERTGLIVPYSMLFTATVGFGAFMLISGLAGELF